MTKLSLKSKQRSIELSGPTNETGRTFVRPGLWLANND
jgi:hypothetical protein